MRCFGPDGFDGPGKGGSLLGVMVGRTAVEKRLYVFSPTVSFALSISTLWLSSYASKSSYRSIDSSGLPPFCKNFSS